MPSMFSSEKLTELRKLKGYSQEKLAEKAGINIRSLQRLEKNEVQPQPHTLKILADALGVVIGDFMTIQKVELPSQIPALLHFSALSGTFIPLGNVIAPFLFWLYQKKDYPELEKQTKQVVNFHLSNTLYIFITLIIFFTMPQLIGILILTVLLGFMIFIFSIINGVRALNNRKAIYPFTIRFWQ
jgi:uncharacterized Tic20 family protein/DNA-binding Xre family transcriptional regulator